MNDYRFNPEDLIINTWSSKPKPNWINDMDKGIQVIHLPTGTVITCEEHRSQHKNRHEAFLLLENELKLLDETYSYDN